MYNSPKFHRTFLNYPYCKPSSCSAENINGWYRYLLRVYSKSNDNGDDTMIQQVKQSACSENPNDLAVMRKKRHNILVKSCKWLKNRPESRLKRYCREKSSMDGYEPAYKVCPLTCCSCVEKEEDTFLRRINVSKSGRMKVVTKTCEWLQSVDWKTRKSTCQETLPSLGGFSDAQKTCPNTCGICSN